MKKAFHFLNIYAMLNLYCNNLLNAKEENV